MSDTESSLPDLRYVRELAKVFKQYGLDEIEIETGDQRILLRRGDLAGPAAIPSPTTVVQALPPTPSPAATAAASSPAAGAAAADAGADFITSPFVGTFYAASSPDAEPFVSVGSKVSAGQSVCIVEAMKLFNEIEAEFACEVLEVLVENGQAVEFGAKLFRVKRQ